MRPSVLVAGGVLIASIAALAWLATTRGELVRPVEVPGVPAATLEEAARSARGRRLLAIVARAGAPPAGRILQSQEGPEGWRAFRPTHEIADPLVPALDALAQAAADDFAPDATLDRRTVTALAEFDVAVVVATDGERVIPPLPAERDPGLGIEPSLPGLRVQRAMPVLLFLAEEPSIDPADPLGFTRALRAGDAVFQDDVYRDWGVGVTIDAATDSEYLLPLPAKGARVTLDGRETTTRTARVPVLLVKVPAGRHRIEVAYGPSQVVREAAVIAAALGIIVSLLVLWIALRAHPEASTEGIEPGSGGRSQRD